MYFVGTQGGVCRDCDLLSHSNCESRGSGHVAVGEKRPVRRSHCSKLRACGRVSTVHLLGTSIKPPCYLLNFRLSFIVFRLPFLKRVEVRGCQIPTNRLKSATSLSR